MANLSDKDISRFYDEVSKNLNRYTWLHIQVISLLIPEMDNYNEIVSNVKGVSRYYAFGGDFIVEKSGINEDIIFQILNDFVKDGLLWVSARLPETTVFSVTERGYNCFGRIIKLFQETK